MSGEDAAGADSPLAFLWDGVPRIGSESGWSVKPRGRLQFDAGALHYPDSTGFADEDDSAFRRARIGIDGTAPGGFGFRFEADFAGNDMEVADAFITYETGDLKLTAGQHNGFQSLEELTSSRFNSFVERAAFTDAFGFQRRLGISAQYSTADLLVQGGIFSANIDDLPSDDWSADARIIAMPRANEIQFHFGGSLHYTRLESGTARRYRQRPAVYLTDRRLIDTGSFPADGELGLGLEVAVIGGPFHVAGEAFWQKVDRPAGLTDPTFFGGYAEIGLLLTPGDTRSYGEGTFGRVKPARPLNEGGPGAVEINLRYDYLDLNDAGIVGGRQNGYLASLVWIPTNYTRLLLDYGRLQYADAIPTIGGDTRYGVDSFAVRAQVDF